MTNTIKYIGSTQRRVNGRRILPGQTVKRGEIPDDAFDSLSQSVDFECGETEPVAGTLAEDKREEE